jgi:xanthine dehydrogenase accessory factor
MPYVALVASPRRAAAVREALVVGGVAPDIVERLKSPAGLDIGARTQEEIALSILAEIVQTRATMAPAAEPVTSEAEAVADGSGTEAIDPVCGMAVMVATARHTSEFGGKTWYFCCSACKARFEADPRHYAAA